MIFDHSHSFDARVAKSFGIHPAIILNHMMNIPCELISEDFLFEIVLEYMSKEDVNKALYTLLSNNLVCKSGTRFFLNHDEV